MIMRPFWLRPGKVIGQLGEGLVRPLRAVAHLVRGHRRLSTAASGGRFITAPLVRYFFLAGLMLAVTGSVALGLVLQSSMDRAAERTIVARGSQDAQHQRRIIPKPDVLAEDDQ
jgi:hypothetical protein